MCRSIRDGGQRCAAHGKARLDVAATALRGALESGDPGAREARARWEQAVSEYASTTTGERAVKAQAEHLRLGGDVHSAIMLETLIRRGQDIRAANFEARVAIRTGRRSVSLPSGDESCAAPQRGAAASGEQAGLGRLSARLG